MAENMESLLQRAAAYAAPAPERLAEFLDQIAEAILAVGDNLISVCEEETGLSAARLTGERARTMNQLRLFAALVQEGSWIDARIDTAQSDRKPLPKPDLRRMLFPIGPVAVFAASNFPFAFSVAGGDTASALAAGCSVVVKPNPGHPETSRLVAGAVEQAIQKTLYSEGVFGMISDTSVEAGVSLVKDSRIKAVGFTGSLAAGRALFDAGASRPDPIPVFSEMSSLNPLFLLPGSLASDTADLAKGLAGSVTLGAGQFCTKPGLVFGVKGAALDSFRQILAHELTSFQRGRMLTDKIAQGFKDSLAKVHQFVQASGGAYLVVVDAKTYQSSPDLHHEIFGPLNVLIECGDGEEMLRLASDLDGQLTASVHGTAGDLALASRLFSILREKAGRVLWNGFPTGVEVCPSMQHGGPFPATTDSRFTSVGTAAILRFARPVCFQDTPQELLPDALKNHNPRGIWRLVNGNLTKNPQ
jgi:alpha-ketoglutaric semialdehyde dehydrogenase